MIIKQSFAFGNKTWKICWEVLRLIIFLTSSVASTYELICRFGLLMTCLQYQEYFEICTILLTTAMQSITCYKWAVAYKQITYKMSKLGQHFSSVDNPPKAKCNLQPFLQAYILVYAGSYQERDKRDNLTSYFDTKIALRGYHFSLNTDHATSVSRRQVQKCHKIVKKM